MSNNANILVDGFTPVTTPSIEATLDVSNNGASDYTIKSSDNVSFNDPTITLIRGKTYEFEVSHLVIHFGLKQPKLQDPLIFLPME